MRTDSTRTSKNFLHSLREYIQNKYSISYLSTDPNFFKQKKYIQDSHEAIRPTSLKYNPNYLKKYLNKEQNKIYHLIWNKFLASQMQKSIYNYINIYFQIKNIIFKSKKTFTLFDGFMRIYNNSSKKKQKIFSNSIFKLKKKDIFNLINLKIDLKSTKSKNRFNESNLIKNLEEKEIGRPSTYALIISNIKNKDYIIKNNTKFQSSKLGTLVLKFLNDSFSSITNTKFTALMEEELDKIEHNLKKWILVIKNFYSIFEKETKHSINYMKDLKNLNKKINKFCKKCNFVLFIKFGKNKKFETCFQYSKCQNQKKIQKKEKNIFPVKFKKYQIKCNLCNSEMILRKSKFGKFFGCKRYPKCIKIINFKYLNINL
jgi:DNA topoisomerase-1